MSTGHNEQEPVPFLINIRGRISVEQAQLFYDRVLKLLEAVGGLSSAQAVDIRFNLPALGIDERKSKSLLEDNGLMLQHKDISDEELATSLVQLGNTIRVRRRELGFSQVAVAIDAGISQSHLSQIELARRMPNGRPVRPRPEVIVGIARSLDFEELQLLEQAGFEVSQIQQSVSE